EMRLGKVDRVKRQLLAEAVADNLDTIRGLPPRSLRPMRRTARIWLRRAPLLLVPAALLGSTYLAGSRNEIAGSHVAAGFSRPMLATGGPKPAATRPESSQPLVRVSASAFPLSVRRIVLDAGHGG